MQQMTALLQCSAYLGIKLTCLEPTSLNLDQHCTWTNGSSCMFFMGGVQISFKKSSSSQPAKVSIAHPVSLTRAGSIPRPPTLGLSLLPQVPLAPPGPTRLPRASLSHGGLLLVRALLYKVEALSSRSPLRRKEPRSNAARAGSGKRVTRPVSRAVNKTTVTVRWNAKSHESEWSPRRELSRNLLSVNT